MGWRCAEGCFAQEVLLANGQRLFLERDLALGLGLDELMLDVDLCLDGGNEFFNRCSSLERISRRDILSVQVVQKLPDGGDQFSHGWDDWSRR